MTDKITQNKDAATRFSEAFRDVISDTVQQSLKSRVDEVKDRVDEVKDRVDEVKDRVDGFRAEMNSRFDDIDKEMSS